jgi:hypothetical protein
MEFTPTELRYLRLLVEAEIERIEQYEVNQPYHLTDLSIASAMKDKIKETINK